MNGGSGAQNIIKDKLLPDFAEGSVKKYVQRAWHMSDPNSNNYNLDKLNALSTYAEWNANEQEGIDNLATRATDGSSVVKKGNDLLEEIFDGSKLNANTTLNDLYTKQSAIIKQEFEEEILPGIEYEALSIGMCGSSGHNIKQTKAAESILVKLIEISKGIYFDDYETARDIQENSLGHGVVYGTESIRNAELLRQAGLYIREYNQGKLEDAYRKWTSRQIHEITKLEILGNAIRATIGSSVTKTEPFFRPKPIAQIAGLALAGAGLFASFYKGSTPSVSPYNSVGQYNSYVPGGSTSGIGTFNPSAMDLGIGNMPGVGGA